MLVILYSILVLRGRDTVKLMQIARYSVLQTILVLRGRDTVKFMQIARCSVLQTILQFNTSDKKIVFLVL